jgi:hypothetical protein
MIAELVKSNRSCRRFYEDHQINFLTPSASSDKLLCKAYIGFSDTTQISQRHRRLDLKYNRGMNF